MACRWRVVSVTGPDDGQVVSDAIDDALGRSDADRVRGRTTASRADIALAAVPDDGDPRTIGQRLEDGATAERLVRWLTGGWQGPDLQQTPRTEIHHSPSPDDPGWHLWHDGEWHPLADVDRAAADLLTRLAGTEVPR